MARIPDRNPDTHRRRWPWWLGGALALPVALLALAWAALQTGPGRDALAGLVEDLVSTPEMRLEIGALEGAPPGEIVLRDVTLSDADGVWLRLDTARLDWRPLALLSGRAEIARLEIGTLALARAPASSETPDEPASLPDELPELPVEIALETLRIERIELAEPVFGAALALQADGHALLTGERLDIELAAAQPDGRATLALTAVYEPATRRLALDLDADAAAGSALAQLAGLPDAPALSLALHGAGDVPGWTGDWRFAAGDKATIGGTAAIEAIAPFRLRLAGEGDVAALLPPEANSLVEPALVFDLALGLDTEDDRIALDIAELNSAALALSGTAALTLPDGALAADLELVAADATALGLLPARTSYDRIAARLRAGGTLERPELSLAGEAAGLVYGDIALATAQLDLAVQSGTEDGVSLRLAGTGLAGPPALQQVLAGDFQLTATGRFADGRLDIAAIAGAAGPLRLDGTAQAELDGGAAEATLTLAYADLARLAPLAGMELAGSMRADLQAARDAEGALTLYLDAAGENVAAGDPALAALLGPAPLLSADAELGDDGALHLHELRLDAAGMNARAQADIPATGELSGELSAELPSLEVLAAAGTPATGAAVLNATLLGTAQAPRLAWDLNGRDVTVSGATLGAVSLRGEASGLPPATRGRLEFATGSPAGEVTGSAGFALGERALEVSDFVLARGEDRIAGGWRTALDTLLSEGALDWRIADLGAYGELAGGLSGGLAGEIGLAAEQGGQTVALRADLRNLGLGEGLDLGATEVDLRLHDALGAPAIDGEVTLARAKLADIALERAILRLDGDFSAIAVTLEAEGQAVHPLRLDAGAEIALAEATEITLQRFELMLGDQPVRLQAPAVLALAGETVELTGLDIALADGRLRADAALGGGRIDIAASGEALPVRLAAAFVPEVDPRGTIDLGIDIAGALPRPAGEITLSGTGLRLAPAIIPDQAALALDLQATLGEGRARGSLAASSIGDPPLSVSFDAPLLVTAPLGISLPQDQPLEVTSRWEGRLKPIMALLPIDKVRIEGLASLDASASGTLGDPVVRGSFAIRDGVYENFEIGTLLRPFEVELRADGPRIEIVRFTGDDTEQGRISASGSIDLGGEAPRFDLRARADGAKLMRTDQAEARINAELALTGSTEAAELNGEITTGRVEISIEGELPAEVQELEVREIDPEGGAEAEPPPPPEVPQVPGLDWLALDLRVNIPQKLFIRGRGLDSEWGGNFEITGTAARPQIRGGLQPVRGGFDIAGKRFELAEGKIGFSGGREIDPVLDLAAVYEEDDFTARVSITGNAENPQIDISSTPALPKDEVIARVLFGKGTGQLTALQGVQVAQTAAALSGGGGGGVLDMARDTLGVDVFTLAPGASDDDLGAIEAGKYIADDVFVGVRQGTTPGSTGAIVEWEVTPNITVESEAGGADESSVGVRWEWDY